MDAARHFSQTYAEARDKFIAATRVRGLGDQRFCASQASAMRTQSEPPSGISSSLKS